MSDETYLSDQQERIVELLDDGRTWKEAAEELGIARSTLDEQMRRVSKKTARCRATLDWLAQRGRGGDSGGGE